MECCPAPGWLAGYFTWLQQSRAFKEVLVPEMRSILLSEEADGRALNLPALSVMSSLVNKNILHTMWCAAFGGESVLT